MQRLRPYRYLLAIGFVFAALLVEAVFWPLMRLNPAPLLLTAVILSAMYGGFGPGLLATVLAVLTGLFLFSPEEGLRQLETQALCELIIFAAVAVLITSLSESKRRATEALREAKEAAEAATRAKDDFLATVTHELRTPLGGILLWAKLLRSGQLRGEKEVEVLDKIIRCGEDQSRLVEDLLDARRAAHGKLHVAQVPVRLDQVLRAAVDSVRPRAQARGVRLESELSGAANTIVLGDAMRLRQVFDNLLDNGVKFTPDGGRVHICAECEESVVRVHVTDTGVGINPEFLPLMFDQFVQADTSVSRAYGGLGLGLSIVKHLVERHGGSISARSDGPGLGTAFIVTFPTIGSRHEDAALTAADHHSSVN